MSLISGPATSHHSSSGKNPLNKKSRRLHDPPVTPTPPFRRIVWALDADLNETGLIQQAARAIAPLADHAQILPIYVIDPGGLSWQGESAPERCHSLRPAVELALSRFLNEVKRVSPLKHLLSPLVLEMSFCPIVGTTRATVRKFLSWARKFGADLILAGYDDHSGVRRLMSSSFTEMVLRESGLPVFSVTHKLKTPQQQYKEIIFPTDFGRACQSSYKKTIDLASHLGSRIRLLHKMNQSTQIIVQSGALLLNGGWAHLSALLDTSNLDAILEQGHRWLNQAKQRHVTTTFETTRSSLSTAATIHTACAAGTAPLLVFTAIDGPLEAGFWGSICTEVLRNCPCPILILRG